MGLNLYVSILNRLVESGMSLNKAYYACFGDNIERHMIIQLVAESNTGSKLEKLLNKEYQRYLKEDN